MDYQRIIVIGNITKDAELKKGEKGEFVILSVATKVRNGSTVYFSSFISGRLAEFAKDTKKGTLVLVDGTLDVSEYRPEGKEPKTDLKIYVDSFRRLSPRGETEKSETQEKPEEIFKAEEEKQTEE